MADAPAAAALSAMLQPDSAAPGGRELDIVAMILPGHQLDFESITFNWSIYLEPPGSAGAPSIGRELPLTAYAVGYSRPKKGVMAETRYSFGLGRILGGLGLVVLCAGLALCGVVALAAFLRRQGG